MNWLEPCTFSTRIKANYTKTPSKRDGKIEILILRSNEIIVNQWSLKCVPHTRIALLGNLFDIPIIRPHRRPTESELGVLTSPPGYSSAC